MSGFADSDVKAKILWCLQSSDDRGATKTEIHRALSRHRKVAEIDWILFSWLRRGLVTRTTEPTGGRPVTRWALNTEGVA